MDISICYEKLKEFADQIDMKHIGFFMWDTKQFINTNDLEILAQYFFIGNAINFCFWFNRYDQRFKYKQYNGSAAMWAVIRDNPRYLDADYLENFTVEREEDILSMPIPFKREMCLRESGKVLNKLYDGKILTLCRKCQWNAISIVEEITQNFSMWNDEYGSIKFHKRAKLFTAMLHGRLGESSPISNIKKVSCLADYQVPKVLEHYGILQYPAYVKEAITRQFIFSPGSQVEFEIRAQTIEAIQKICDYMITKGKEICPLELDYYIWSLSHSIECPHHLTITTAY